MLEIAIKRSLPSVMKETVDRGEQLARQKTKEESKKKNKVSDKERKAIKKYEEFLMADPWSKLVTEVYYLRDYYVEEALIKQGKGTGYPDFFDIKVYENEFIPSLEKKFGI